MKMPVNNYLITAISIVPADIVFVELFLLLPFLSRVKRLQTDSAKALSVMGAKKISDHWKEKVIPRYAREIMASSLLLGVYLVILFCAFSLTFFLFGLLLFDGQQAVIRQFYQLETQGAALVFGCFYAFLRNKVTKNRQQHESDYTFLSSFLHWLALNYDFVREVAFDVDTVAARSRRQRLQPPPPVFVAGLARGGTTILLEALYSSGKFATLTYRDMPFVTAPYLWSKISGGHHDQADLQERAHGDRLQVNFDSPEAFEEVFWKTFSHDGYVKKSCLDFQKKSREIIEKYQVYVGNILAASTTDVPLAYLAKNNNNLLRIDMIKAAFPEAVVIVPFRNPYDHARSLLGQHKRFLQVHGDDPFSLKYMNWLGHHEFGANVKPFNVGPEVIPANDGETEKLDYWLNYWHGVYQYILENHGSQVIFFDYDHFCAEPKSVLRKLSDRLALDPLLLQSFAGKILPARKYAHQGDGDFLCSDRVMKLYEKLKQKSNF